MAARRTKKRTGPPRCEVCGALVTFFRLPSDEYAPFRIREVNPNAATGGRIYPIFGGRAWHLDDLIEELMARSEQSRQDARDEAYALPWHVTHTCAPATTTEQGEDHQ